MFVALRRSVTFGKRPQYSQVVQLARALRDIGKEYTRFINILDSFKVLSQCDLCNALIQATYQGMSLPATWKLF